MNAGMIYWIKLMVLGLLLLGLAIYFLVMVEQRRDGRLYHWVSKVISPFSIVLLPRAKADPFPVNEDFQEAGFDSSWKWFQREQVTADFSNLGLKLDAATESVWYQNERGPMLYRNFDGDGRISVTVEARKTSEPLSYPDSEWQFAGLIFRNPDGDAWFSKENYIFNVIGFRKSALQIEVKSTCNGFSEVKAVDWMSGDAELLIERRKGVFSLKARHLDSEEWQLIEEYTRPDLPSLLQVGIIVYSYSEGRQNVDLSARFLNLQVGVDIP